MIPWFKALLFDATVFERASRVAIFALGEALKMGAFPTGTKGWWAGLIIQPFALFLGAGQKNEPPPK